ncbi:MAG TPA: molybdate ABC transporter substrate-binding protein [Thermoanaerobaculia bacterium]
MPRALLVLLLLALPLRAEIVVSAAASLDDVLTEASAAWTRRSGEAVRVNLGASHALAMQIVAGAPADLFISATGADLDLLQGRGLTVAGSRRTLASNALVVIVPRGSRLALHEPRQLAQPGVRRLALADLESSPAGIHAKRYLQRAGVWAAVATRVIPAADVRAALAIVGSGAADAGIVYRTDALSSAAVRIAFVPAAPAIGYDAALVRRPSLNPSARGFLDFLASPAGQKIFQKQGFAPARPTGTSRE